MSEDTTATTLILIGAIFQIIIAVFLIVGGAASSIGIAIGFLFGGISTPLDWIWVFIPGIPLVIFGIIGFLFAIFWLQWRHTPSEYKQNLILTGIVALIFTGILPGLLIVIGGAIASEEAE